MAKIFLALPEEIPSGKRMSVINENHIMTVINNSSKKMNNESHIGRIGTLEKGKTKFIFLNDYEKNKRQSNAPMGILVDQIEGDIEIMNNDRVSFSSIYKNKEERKTYVMALAKPGAAIKFISTDAIHYSYLSVKGWKTLTKEEYEKKGGRIVIQ